MKICLLGDLHAGVHKGHSAFADALKLFIERTLIPKLERENITTIIQLGDVVDRRNGISYVTMNRIRNDVVIPLMEASIDLHVIVGNHDVPYKDTLRPSAPVELFHGYPVHIYDEPTETTIGDFSCVMLPWICQENYEKTFDILKRTNKRIVFGHLELNGFDMYKGQPCYDGIDSSIFQQFDFVGSGHFHQPSTSGVIHYLGAPAEYTWADFNCPRGFWIFDTATLQCEFVANPNRMFFDIADYTQETTLTKYRDKFVRVVVDKRDPLSFEAFITRLEQASPANIVPVDQAIDLTINDAFDVEQQEIDQMKIFTDYIDSIDQQQLKTLNRERLKSIICSTYNQALSV